MCYNLYHVTTTTEVFLPLRLGYNGLVLCAGQTPSGAWPTAVFYWSHLAVQLEGSIQVRQPCPWQ